MTVLPRSVVGLGYLVFMSVKSAPGPMEHACTSVAACQCSPWFLAVLGALCNGLGGWHAHCHSTRRRLCLWNGIPSSPPPAPLRAEIHVAPHIPSLHTQRCRSRNRSLPVPLPHVQSAPAHELEARPHDVRNEELHSTPSSLSDHHSHPAAISEGKDTANPGGKAGEVLGEERLAGEGAVLGDGSHQTVDGAPDQKEVRLSTATTAKAGPTPDSVRASAASPLPTPTSPSAPAKGGAAGGVPAKEPVTCQVACLSWPGSKDGFKKSNQDAYSFMRTRDKRYRPVQSPPTPCLASSCRVTRAV